MKFVDAVCEIVERHMPEKCPECRGTGKVNPSKLFAYVCFMSAGRVPAKVMCLKCHGEGVTNGICR